MYGHVLVLAGSLPYSGAALLCVGGALRCGAGLVTLGLPASLAGPVIGVKPLDAMLLPLPETGEGTIGEKAFPAIRAASRTIDVIAAGPGLGLNASTQRLAQKLFHEITRPLVLDASALDALASRKELLKRAKKIAFPRVLTPHPGEMARLAGVTIEEIQNNRKKIAKNFANEYNVTVILKGKDTVVASPDGSLYINTTGNPGMARGGSGDILPGMVAAFLGQGLNAFDAAKYAVHLHGMAGDLAAKENTQLGMTASDIVGKIPPAIRAASR